MGISISKDLSVAKHYTSRAMIFGIVVALVAILLGYKGFGKAFLLGTLCSCINVVLMNLFYSNLLFKTKKMAGFMAFLSVLIRFSVLAIPLILALTNERFNIIGACLGIFSVQMVIVWENMVLTKLRKNN